MKLLKGRVIDLIQLDGNFYVHTYGYGWAYGYNYGTGQGYGDGVGFGYGESLFVGSGEGISDENWTDCVNKLGQQE